MEFEEILEAVAASNLEHYMKAEVIDIVKAWREKTTDTAEPDPCSVVLEIIREHEKEFNISMERSEVLIEAAGAQLAYEDVIAALEKLKADGLIYDPNRDGRYKTV